MTEEDKENSVANVEIDLDVGVISPPNDSRFVMKFLYHVLSYKKICILRTLSI